MTKGTTLLACGSPLRCYGAALLCVLANSQAMAADVASERGRPLIGVQRWDMYNGKGYTYEQELGYLPGAQGFLKPAEWHDRAPFFCRLTKDVDWVRHPADAGPLWFNYPFSQKLLQRTMDQEIRYQWPRKGDLAARVKVALDYVAAHPKQCEAQVFSMYSWNEFSEGGGLCPTMGSPPEYRPVTKWLDEVAGALAAWEYPQEANRVPGGP